MARVGPVLVLVVLLVASSLAIRSKRIRRGYNNGYGDSSSGYGRSSDERDASVSEEGGGCSGGGYAGGRGYSGSREIGYNRDGRPLGETRGGRSFSKATASAVASSSAFSQNQKTNAI